jgi:hypothetical protein
MRYLPPIIRLIGSVFVADALEVVASQFAFGAQPVNRERSINKKT